MQDPQQGNNRMGWLYDIIAEQAVKHELSHESHRWLRQRMAQADLATRDPAIRKRSPFWTECLPKDDSKLWWHGFNKYKGGDRYPLSLNEVLAEYEGRNSFRSFLSDNWDEGVEKESDKREWIMDVFEEIRDFEAMSMAQEFLRRWEALPAEMSADDLQMFHARFQTVVYGTNLQAENPELTEFLTRWEQSYEEGAQELAPEVVKDFLEQWFTDESMVAAARKLFTAHVANRLTSGGNPFFQCRAELAKTLGLEIVSSEEDSDSESADGKDGSAIGDSAVRLANDWKEPEEGFRGRELFGKLQEECEDGLRPCYDRFYHQHPLMFELMVKSLKGADFLDDDDDDDDDDDGDGGGSASPKSDRELLKDVKELDGGKKKKAEKVNKRKLDVEALLKPSFFKRPDGWTFDGAFDADTGQRLQNRRPIADRLQRFRSLRIRCTRHNKAGGKSMYVVVRVDSKTCRTADSGRGDYFMSRYCKSCRTKAQKVKIYDPKCPKCDREGSLIKEWMMFELTPTTQFVEVSIWKTEKDEFVAGNRMPVVDILYPKVASADEERGEDDEEDDDPDDGIFKRLLDKNGQPCDWSIKFKAVPSEEEADRNIDPTFDPKRMILDRPGDYIVYDQIFEDREQNSAFADKIRNKVSKKKRRWKYDGFDLDLTYVTSRIIAMGYPSVGAEGVYRNHMKDVQKFFAKRHPASFKLYNLCSERKYDPVHFDGAVCRYPFDDHNPCPFELIERFCEDVRQFLTAHPQNVVAIHCKAGKGRTGTVIAAFLCYLRQSLNYEDALFYFGNMRTQNKKGVTIPSQMRYVYYFDKYCRMKSQRQTAPGQATLFIEGMVVYTLPKLDSGEVGFTIKFQNSDLKYKNRVSPELLDLGPDDADKRIVFDFRSRPIPVREDVLIIVKGSKKLFQCWFNTRWSPLTMTTDGTRRPNIIFDKMQLDKAIKDCKKHKKLSPAVKFEIIFSRSRDIQSRLVQELVEEDLRQQE